MGRGAPDGPARRATAGLVGAALGALAALVGCDLSNLPIMGNQAQQVVRILASQVEVMDSTGAITTSVTRSKPLTFLVELANPTTVDARLTFADPPVRVVVLDDGFEVWRSGAVSIGAATGVAQTLAPGTVIVFRVPWDGISAAGKPLDAGNYVARATVLPGSSDEKWQVTPPADRPFTVYNLDKFGAS